MKINSIHTINKTSFGIYGGSTENVGANNSNKINECIHESHFMRNLESLDFTAKYIIKNFPNGTHIADFGCSNGEETYSLATLLHKSNQNKKYTLTGFDIIPHVIEDAKTGLLAVGYRGKIKGEYKEDKYEKFLVDMFAKLTPEQTEAKNAFETCFMNIPNDWWFFNIHDSRYRHKLKDNKYVKPKPTDDLDLIAKRLKLLLLPNEHKPVGVRNVIPRDGIFDGIVSFRVADALRMDEILIPKSTGIIIFKNSLYHLLGNRPKKGEKDIILGTEDLKPAKILFKKIHDLLPKDGIFVLGSLQCDHLFYDSILPNEQIAQNGKLINVYNNSLIHNELYKAGFEPIFYETAKTGGLDFKSLTTYLPSVWKKVEKKSLVSNLVTNLQSLSKSTAKLF